MINADDNYRYNFQQVDGAYKTRYNAVIGLYTTEGKPGITVRNIPWVELTYEFFESGTMTPISIKGNTSYYDIDEFQVVFLDDTCKEIYVTDGEVEGSYVDEDGVLYELPSIGGHGTYWYTCGGLVLMLGGALMLYSNRHKIFKKMKNFNV